MADPNTDTPAPIDAPEQPTPSGGSNVLSNLGLLLQNIAWGASGKGGENPIESAQSRRIKLMIAQQNSNIAKLDATTKAMDQFGKMREGMSDEEATALGQAWVPLLTQSTGNAQQSQALIGAALKHGKEAQTQANILTLQQRLKTYQDLIKDAQSGLPDSVRQQWADDFRTQYPNDSTGNTTVPLDALISHMTLLGNQDKRYGVLVPSENELALLADPKVADRIALGIGVTPPSIMAEVQKNSAQAPLATKIADDVAARARESTRLEQERASRLNIDADAAKQKNEIKTFYNTETKQYQQTTVGEAMKNPTKWAPLVQSQKITQEVPTALGPITTTTVSGPVAPGAERPGQEGVTSLKYPTQALPKDAQDNLTSSIQGLNTLSSLDANRDAGSVIFGIFKKALANTGLDKQSSEFNIAANNYRILLQSAIKGNPSDKDQTLIDAVTPQLTDAPSVIAMKTAAGVNLMKSQIKSTLAYYMGGNYMIPAETLTAARDLGIDPATIEPFRQKPGETISDYLARYDAHVREHLFTDMSTDQLLAVDKNMLSSVARQARGDELRRRLDAIEGKK